MGRRPTPCNPLKRVDLNFDKNIQILSSENRKEVRRRSRFVGNGEENAAAEGSFQSKPPEYTAVAKPFPKEICEPARRKILDQAKFLSKGRFMGH